MDNRVIIESALNRNNMLYGKTDEEVQPKNYGPACVDRHGESMGETEVKIEVAEPKEKPVRPC